MSQSPAPSSTIKSTTSTSTSNTTTTNDPTSTSKLKARIITHMNTSHRDSLSLYLQHYNKIPLLYCSPQDSSLIDITPEHLLLSSKWGRSIIKFHPPMSSLSESRERVVSMHKDCLLGLDLSPVKITEFRGFFTGVFDLFWATFCLWTFTTLTFRECLLPPPENSSMATKYLTHLGYMGWSINGLLPVLPWLGYRLSRFVLGFMCVAHFTEGVHFARTRLGRHQIPMFSGLWWKWMGTCALDGFMTFIRFGKLVERKELEIEKEGKNH